MAQPLLQCKLHLFGLTIGVNGMKILRVKRTNLYDVYLGNGWTNHTRIMLKDAKADAQYIQYISGHKLTKIQSIQALKTIQAGEFGIKYPTEKPHEPPRGNYNPKG